MDNRVRELAARLLSAGYDDLPPREQRVLRRIAARTAISRDISITRPSDLSFGERVSDQVAAFGGSWTFIFLFAGVIAAWVVVNVWVMSHPADPYPFIFLNLILSMVAAVQAPVIMMSQNRQAAKDREVTAHDYEVNLKAELEIMSLHEKIDDLRMRQLGDHFERIEARLAAIEAAQK
ncbi:MAG: DUF1003 domain-containing protein [Proteobacteria bacterium]|nr:DUF1003 domain-containing protein [Pseudomonadota bacterium]MBS0573187.1 DUF1003 domain-containing protein [Pseudomonadota bacterium]